MEKILGSRRLYKFLSKIDGELAALCRRAGCLLCQGVLHSAKYVRKPRGLAAEEAEGWSKRDSFCCATEGCRKRHTPPSVRFLGRKVYVGVVVVLVTAMMHGVNTQRVERLRLALGIDERTLKRWRSWWLETFPRRAFWKAERSRFMPGPDETALPRSLVEAFGAESVEGLIRLMKFLRPITIGPPMGVWV
jgi:hypothetical protein